MTQFTSAHERERLDQSLQGPRGLLIRRERYGMTLRGVGIVRFNLPMVPVVLLIGLVCGTMGADGGASSLGGLFMLGNVRASLFT